MTVTGRLTGRDRYICRLLDEHRVLTTGQVADTGFSGERRARERLWSSMPWTFSTASALKHGDGRPRSTGCWARWVLRSWQPKQAAK